MTKLTRVVQVALTIALAVGADFTQAETGWTVRCENTFSCNVETRQCDLRIILFDRATTQGHWVGIVDVPRGWDRVMVRVSKANAIEVKTIQGPQLPRMAFGDQSVKDLMLAGDIAEIDIFLGDHVTKSCRVSLEGLARAYKNASERLK